MLSYSDTESDAVSTQPRGDVQVNSSYGMVRLLAISKRALMFLVFPEGRQSFPLVAACASAAGLKMLAQQMIKQLPVVKGRASR